MREADKASLLKLTVQKIVQAQVAALTSTEEIRLTGQTSNTLEDPLPVWSAQELAGTRGVDLNRWLSFHRDLQAVQEMDSVGPGAQVTVSIDGREERLLVMRTRVWLPDRLVITPEAPVLPKLSVVNLFPSALYLKPHKVLPE